MGCVNPLLGGYIRRFKTSAHKLQELMSARACPEVCVCTASVRDFCAYLLHQQLSFVEFFFSVARACNASVQCARSGGLLSQPVRSSSALHACFSHRSLL